MQRITLLLRRNISPLRLFLFRLSWTDLLLLLIAAVRRLPHASALQREILRLAIVSSHYFKAKYLFSAKWHAAHIMSAAIRTHSPDSIQNSLTRSEMNDGDGSNETSHNNNNYIKSREWLFKWQVKLNMTKTMDFASLFLLNTRPYCSLARSLGKFSDNSFRYCIQRDKKYLCSFISWFFAQFFFLSSSLRCASFFRMRTVCCFSLPLTLLLSQILIYA